MPFVQFEETPLPTFTLPRMVKGSKTYPGIKDLPVHIRQNFRNEFIRFVIKQVASSESPWTNPDIDSLQAMYQLVYPIFPARIRHSDAVHHPVCRLSSVVVYGPNIVTKTMTSLGVLRNNIASAAIIAVQRHLTGVFRAKRLNNVEARAKYIAQLFKSAKDHPIIWREYVEGNIQNHPEVGGYKTVCHFSYFVLNPSEHLTDEAGCIPI